MTIPFIIHLKKSICYANNIFYKDNHLNFYFAVQKFASQKIQESQEGNGRKGEKVQEFIT